MTPGIGGSIRSSSASPGNTFASCRTMDGTTEASTRRPTASDPPPLGHVRDAVRSQKSSQQNVALRRARAFRFDFLSQLVLYKAPAQNRHNPNPTHHSDCLLPPAPPPIAGKKHKMSYYGQQPPVGVPPQQGAVASSRPFPFLSGFPLAFPFLFVSILFFP
jgi:hypothetical protein